MRMLSTFHSLLMSTRLREITNLLTWANCFLTFIAAKTDCEATHNLMAYAQSSFSWHANKANLDGWPTTSTSDTS